MKRRLCLLMGLVIACLSLGSAMADLTVIEPDMNLQLSQEVMDATVKTNPAQEGLSPLTGLPMTEEYTPIALVIDNSPEAYPHWGVAEADWIVQVPLRRDGGTRLVAVYGTEYPEQAGGARSARMTTFPVAVMFKAGAAMAGWPPTHGWMDTVNYWIDEWDYNKPIRYFDLTGTKYRERVDFQQEPQNLSAHVQEMHQYFLTKSSAKFERRDFLFTDDPLTRGDAATSIYVDFMSVPHEDLKYPDGFTPEKNTNNSCSFAYEEGVGYTRESVSGIYHDMNSEDPMVFSNVIVMRSEIHWDGDYAWYKDHLRYCGQAEIFQNGRHITGAWYRRGRLARLILLDENGQEISLQRGKTFLIIDDESAVVSYE